MTGHLVLSSLHTNDAPSALPRLLDMGAPAFLLSSTVNLVIAQRLVRRICPLCTESYSTTPETTRLIKAQLELVGAEIKSLPGTLYHGRGCNVCGNSGFQGQIGIYEFLRVTESIRELILREASVSEVRKMAISEGMTTMFEDGLDKVERGVTTIEEIMRVAKE
ncbi:MAG: ATPase, T2SS/T4P/T4SS family [Bacteroidota bacterium]